MSATRVDPRSPGFVDAILAAACERGKLDEQAAARARHTQVQTGDRIDLVLTELGLISTEDMLVLLSDMFGIPLAADHELASPCDEIDDLPLDFLRRVGVLPLRRQNETLVVAVADPFDGDMLDALSYETELKLHLRLASRAQLSRALGRLAGSPDEAPEQSSSAAGASALDVERLKESASEAPVVRFATRVIATATRARASDIHLERLQGGMVVRFRIDGVLVEHERVTADFAASVISRLKIMAGLNIAEHRMPQDGRIRTVVDGRVVDIRVATTPVLHGEAAVLRLLGRSHGDVELSRLGLSSEAQAFVERVTQHPHGLLLVTGPTGSGKSTTLYAVLKRLNNGERKIISIEDPVEIAIDGITQIPVRSALGLGFAQVLRTVLRHDPDVIMVGEMRDEETARIGVQAAMTGHLVLSTLHTNSAAGAIIRMVDLGLPRYLLASTLQGVISQRLVRRLCSRCAAPAADHTELVLLAQMAARDANSLSKRNLKVGVGCEACHATGFLGRISIAEAVAVEPSIRSLIAEGATEHELEQAARRLGFRSLLEDGLEKVLDGQTTAAEVMRVIRGAS